MVIIRFPDDATERRALGFIAKRVSGRTWATGDTMVPEAALEALTAAGIPYIVNGPPTYAQLAETFRGPVAEAVQ
jgi:hypothetical protein